ncbi:MAG: hypothetical protein NT071_05485 [Burkholderiales bacterium]|nr:hypothetical protein [Burkholderiales bacterium]
MITAALRSSLLALVLTLLSVAAWACTANGAAAPLATTPTQTSAHGQIALRHTADALTASLGSTRADAQHLAGTSCKNCEIYASCCHTPALVPGWRLALAPRLPQASFPDTATPFASATDTPRLKPPMS